MNKCNQALKDIEEEIDLTKAKNDDTYPKSLIAVLIERHSLPVGCHYCELKWEQIG